MMNTIEAIAKPLNQQVAAMRSLMETDFLGEITFEVRQRKFKRGSCVF